MNLDPVEIGKIESFRKTDRLNNVFFSLLMVLVLAFLILNIVFVIRLAVEFKIPAGRVFQLFQHVEFSSGVEWYEVHIIRRLGYIIIGVIILVFFPLFYLMGRNEMLLAAKCYEALGKKENSKKTAEE